ncbi:MAG TPA: type II toxin-antitoxin system PemK/MazF family toxin [Allosphingosinicella sp.]|nr:type II toxin-antitoxin system PemK/MazF family toxin [Allosphingosinicella sp.]
MRRGDVVTVALGAGFGGKPRPALVIQSDLFDDLSTVVLALFTSTDNDVGNVRPSFEPDEKNGLIAPSELMVDILVTARRQKVGKVVGRLSAADMERTDRALAVFLGLAD